MKRKYRAKRDNLRIFPPFIVNQVLEYTLLIGRILVTNLQDLGIVENVVVETQNLFILAIHGRHDGEIRRRWREQAKEFISVERNSSALV